jgi:pimeloyl-ACP methyl ester carboxylesterase
MAKRMAFLLTGIAAVSLGLTACAGVPAAPPPARTTETTVDVGNGIAGILTKPASAQKAPAVLMLHGFGSHKDEVGNMYKRLAASLADRGVASLRIDFRGFGKSDGDTGAITVDAQVEDANTAYDYLSKVDFVDPERIGVMGFSLGGGVASMAAAQNPERFKSMATWSSVGNFDKDFSDPPYDKARVRAAEDGVVGLDLGWRTIVLKKDFFDSLAKHDIAAAITQFPGAYLAIAGSEDFSAAYAQGFVDSAPGSPKEAWIVEEGDHIFGVLGEDQTMADSVIEKTADWFAGTL